MTSRFPTRWAIAAFVLLGVLVALLLLVRDLGGDQDVPEETGTSAVLAAASDPGHQLM